MSETLNQQGPTVAALLQDVTGEVVRRARALTFDALPDAVVRRAQHCVLDWLGVTIAGAVQEATAIARAEALDEGGAPRATLLGTGERVTVRQAALVNGIASHVLDYDDVGPAMGGHPSVPVLPALMALAEERDLHGADAIAAFVAGFETESRVGRLVAPEHYERGFHTTGTVGTFGAAAACASALGLDESQWRQALGIAGTQAAGLKSMFGTMSKPLHAGKAAVNGLSAARLAGRGFTANPAVLDVPQGFTSTHTATANPEKALELGPEEFDIRDVLFKFHAACFLTHSSVEGLLRIRESENISPTEVLSVEIRVPPGHLDVCNILEPTTPLEGKFSLRFTSALALARGDVSERAFTPAALTDPDLVALRDRVVVVPEAGRSALSTVTVQLATGKRVSTTADVFHAVPEDQLDREWQRLETKFRGLVEPILGERRAQHLVEIVAALPDLASVRQLADAAAPASRAGDL